MRLGRCDDRYIELEPELKKICKMNYSSFSFKKKQKRKVPLPIREDEKRPLKYRENAAIKIESSAPISPRPKRNKACPRKDAPSVYSHARRKR